MYYIILLIDAQSDPTILLNWSDLSILILKSIIILLNSALDLSQTIHLSSANRKIFRIIATLKLQLSKWRFDSLIQSDIVRLYTYCIKSVKNPAIGLWCRHSLYCPLLKTSFNYSAECPNQMSNLVHIHSKRILKRIWSLLHSVY